MRSKLLIGLTAAVATAAIAGPAQAQTPAAGPSVAIGNCTVAKSRLGYAYATCSIVASIPSGQSVTVQYHSSMGTFKPRTNGTWRAQNGTYTLSDDGTLPGQGPGTTDTEVGALKLAFRGRSITQVRNNLKVFIASDTTGAIVTDPVGVVSKSA